MSATFRKDKRGVHEDKDRGHGRHWKCHCQRCQDGKQHKHKTAYLTGDDTTKECSRMITDEQ